MSHNVDNPEILLAHGGSIFASELGDAIPDPIVPPVSTGWTPITGTADKALVLDVATVTLPQLAARVKAIQDLLATNGIIST